jgi:proteasome-associated ATPase
MPVTRNGAAPASETPRTLNEHLKWVQKLVAEGQDLQPLVISLFEEKFQLHQVIKEVRAHQEAMREEITALCAPECYPVVITAVPASGETVEVATGGGRVRVAIHPEVDQSQLRIGVRGILTKARNCLMAIEESGNEWMDVGTFESYLPEEGRMLLRYQEQLIAVTGTEDLATVELRKGDLVGFDREGPRLAYRKVDPPGKQDLFFENTPEDHFGELGGLDPIIARLQWIVKFRLQHEGIAQKYRLPAKRGILLEGPPGNGKTKLARCLARFVASLVPAGECRFMAISGSSDYSMWLGQSEQKLIARFDAARELATRDNIPVVMFFDEIDAIGRRRGSDLGGGAPDRILATFLSQLDGVHQVSNLIVIGATNRADILDPGLVRPGRLGDVKITIPPPNRQGSQAILDRYLQGVPVDGERDWLIKSLLSQVYSERSPYGELARVRLRDGRQVEVRGRDLISGALLENLVRQACEVAADREARTGQAGVSEQDLSRALDRELLGIARLLTPGNVRGYVHRLPQDIDPVAVDVVHRGMGSGSFTRSV